MKQDVIIIGGGASGLFAAIKAAAEGCHVTILDANEKMGKKILATGNGRCNLSHMEAQKDSYYAEDDTFVSNVLNQFSYLDTIEAFEKMGMAVKNKEGYLYPNSMQASTVVATLVSGCQLLGVTMVADYIVTNVVVQHGKEKRFRIEGKCTDGTSQCDYYADKVLMAFGSKAGLKNEYTSDLLDCLKTMGHTVIKPQPALCSIYVRKQKKEYRNFFKNASGVRSEIQAKWIRNQECLADSKGELQITDYGLSGIVIFQLSRMISRALAEEQETDGYIEIDFLPGFLEDEAFCLLKKQQFYQKKTLLDLCAGLLNKKLATELLRLYTESTQSEIFAHQKNVSDESLMSVIRFLKHVEFYPEKPNDFQFAQVCCGGIRISEICVDTMESKRIPKLYFSGECMDVDGICGGYNLQWAWSTGYLAGRSLAND